MNSFGDSAAKIDRDDLVPLSRWAFKKGQSHSILLFCTHFQCKQHLGQTHLRCEFLQHASPSCSPHAKPLRSLLITLSIGTLCLRLPLKIQECSLFEDQLDHAISDEIFRHGLPRMSQKQTSSSECGIYRADFDFGFLPDSCALNFYRLSLSGVAASCPFSSLARNVSIT